MSEQNKNLKTNAFTDEQLNQVAGGVVRTRLHYQWRCPKCDSGRIFDSMLQARSYRDSHNSTYGHNSFIYN